MKVSHGPQTLRDAVNGDLAAFGELTNCSHSALQEYAPQAGGLTLRPEAVRRVLVALEQGDASPSLVQKWASFVRRGYISDGHGSAGSHQSGRPIRAIAIDYDHFAEEQIAQVISRLDEIGDSVDGEIDQNEIGAMLHQLP